MTLEVCWWLGCDCIRVVVIALRRTSVWMAVAVRTTDVSK